MQIQLLDTLRSIRVLYENATPGYYGKNQGDSSLKVGSSQGIKWAGKADTQVERFFFVGWGLIGFRILCLNLFNVNGPRWLGCGRGRWVGPCPLLFKMWAPLCIC